MNKEGKLLPINGEVESDGWFHALFTAVFRGKSKIQDVRLISMGVRMPKPKIKERNIVAMAYKEPTLNKQTQRSRWKNVSVYCLLGSAFRVILPLRCQLEATGRHPSTEI